MIIHSNLHVSLEVKNKILPTCLQGNYRGSLGEFKNTSYVFGAERVKNMVSYKSLKLTHPYMYM